MEEDGNSREKGNELVYALLTVMAAVLGLSAAVILKQVVSARTGEAGTVPSASEASFEAPAPTISLQRQVLALSEEAPRWLANARPFPLSPERSALAVIVIDPVEGKHLADAVLAKDRNITLAVAHDFDTSRWRVQNMRREGHEIVTLLPTGYAEDFSRYANVLGREIGPSELRRRVGWHLAATPVSVGAMDAGGGDVLRDAQALTVAMAVLAEAGVLYVDARSNRTGFAAPIARAAGVPTAQRTVRIAARDDAAQIVSKLEEAEEHARRWQNAVVVVEATEGTLDALGGWLESRDASIALAPVSAVVARLRSGVE